MTGVCIAGDYSPPRSRLSDNLPLSVQESIQNVLANGAFFTHTTSHVLLPPPIGLFSNMSPAVKPQAGSSNDSLPLLSGISISAGSPCVQTSNGAGSKICSIKSTATNIKDNTKNQRRMPSSACSETDSDDGKSQCSTASYDGSQRSQGKDCLAAEVEATSKKRTWKVLLTSEQACEVKTTYLRIENYISSPNFFLLQIYESRPRSESEKSLTSAASRSQQTAERYNVNAKTIRDIWNRITWIKATRSLWTDEVQAHTIDSVGVYVPPTSRPFHTFRCTYHSFSHFPEYAGGRIVYQQQGSAGLPCRPRGARRPRGRVRRRGPGPS
jgi:hypothetical protein